jgi:ligand-binding sensor domain-containing protein
MRDASGTLSPFPTKTLLPWSDVTVLASDNQHRVWIGTSKGLILIDGENATQAQYFAGRRWLRDDRVTAIGLETRGSTQIVWIETSTGMSREAL